MRQAIGYIALVVRDYEDAINFYTKTLDFEAGGRVFLFLHTDDFCRDFRRYKERGVVFVREPKEESYGVVAVFRDLYGNLWDLLQLR